MKRYIRYAHYVFFGIWLFWLLFTTFYRLIQYSKRQYAGSAWDELKHIRQAIGFLVLFSFNHVFIATKFYYPNAIKMFVTYEGQRQKIKIKWVGNIKSSFSMKPPTFYYSCNNASNMQLKKSAGTELKTQVALVHCKIGLWGLSPLVPHVASPLPPRRG